MLKCQVFRVYLINSPNNTQKRHKTTHSNATTQDGIPRQSDQIH